MRHVRPPTFGTAILIDSILVIAAALVAWGFHSGPVREGGVPGTHPRSPRSPLERSPGYYAPDDPESSSVARGRRYAPRVAFDLTGGASSLGDLARLLLADVEARDERAMHALRLTRREFQVICWPEFPQSRPITRITADDAWEFSLPTSLAGAGRTIGLYGGRDLSKARVTAGRIERYRNFTLHRDVVITAWDAQAKEWVSLRFVPSVVERHGQFKALLFKD